MPSKTEDFEIRASKKNCGRAHKSKNIHIMVIFHKTILEILRRRCHALSWFGYEWIVTHAPKLNWNWIWKEFHELHMVTCSNLLDIFTSNPSNFSSEAFNCGYPQATFTCANLTVYLTVSILRIDPIGFKNSNSSSVQNGSIKDYSPVTWWMTSKIPAFMLKNFLKLLFEIFMYFFCRMFPAASLLTGKKPCNSRYQFFLDKGSIDEIDLRNVQSANQFFLSISNIVPYQSTFVELNS